MLAIAPSHKTRLPPNKQWQQSQAALSRAQVAVNSDTVQKAFDNWSKKGVLVSAMVAGFKNGRAVINVGVAAPVTNAIRRKMPKQIDGFPIELYEQPYVVLANRSRFRVMMFRSNRAGKY
ncbi:MAG: hypothetical protein ACRD19_11945 [Terriglobia bacterium]